MKIKAIIQKRKIGIFKIYPVQRLVFMGGIFALLSVLTTGELYAASAKRNIAQEADLLWLLMAAFLVFSMQAGFAYVEAGFTRKKNVVNILMKNLMDFSIGTLGFWLIGFSLMFGPQLISGFGIGQIVSVDSFLLDQGKPVADKFGFLLFQSVFAGTAATIASGAMAERTRFYAYLVASSFITVIIYPIFGSFAWSSLFDSNNVGWLAKHGFVDFAGSTVVHSLGGWIALAGTIVLGPRIGKYRDNKNYPIFGHNMAMATLGVFILWFGWFGFNAGSTGSIAHGEFAIVALVTNVASATGGLSAMFLSWILFRRPDISMTLNGFLAGLVAITAPCYNVGLWASFIIGLVAGIIVVVGVIFLDKIHVDDPVGAVSVHGFSGAWGTISVAFFANPHYGDGLRGIFYGGSWNFLGIQAVGVIVAFIWAFGAGLVLFMAIKYIIGLRVPVEEEIEGLDIVEHGNEGYPELN